MKLKYLPVLQIYFQNIDDNRSPPTDKKHNNTYQCHKREKKSKHDIKKDSIKPFNGKRSINELKILLKTLDNDKIEMLELNIINNIKNVF